MQHARTGTVSLNICAHLILSCSRGGETIKRGAESVGEGDKGKKVRTTSDDTGGKSEREREVSVHGWGSIADQDSGSTADAVCYLGGKGLETEGLIKETASRFLTH
jgi:hypothetical protein